MGRDLALEHVDVARAQLFAQMVIGAPVAEPELQHVARQRGDQLRSMVQARALRFEPPDE